MVSANGYYRKRSFGLKLTLVDKLAQRVTAHRFIDWISLKRDLDSKSLCRNSLAHRPAHLVSSPDGSVIWNSSNQFLNLCLSGKFQDIAFQYDTKGCLGLYSCFTELTQRVDTERDRIPHKFANNKLIT